MNETLKVLETRRSCRNFDKERAAGEWYQKKISRLS